MEWWQRMKLNHATFTRRIDGGLLSHCWNVMRSAKPDALNC